MEPRSQDECLIDPNPDIRISLYVLAFSGHLSWAFGLAEVSNAIQSSLGLTGLALLLTAVISTARRTISLFHALCIFHLLGIVGLAIQPRGRYPSSAVRMYTFSALCALFAAGSLIYLIYVFATAPTFGDQAECNKATIYVLFGVELPATNPVLRWIFVAVLSFLLLGLIIALLILWCISLDAILRRSPRGTNEADTKRKPAIYEVTGYTVGTIYLAVMIELMIRRNDLAPGVDSWTFGQVLAMTMLIGPLVEFASWLLAKVDGEQLGQDHPETAVSRLTRHGMP